MFGGLFGWLRLRTREAVLAGAADALEELEGERPDHPAAAVDRLRGLLAAQAPAMPAPEVDGGEPVEGRRLPARKRGGAA